MHPYFAKRAAALALNVSKRANQVDSVAHGQSKHLKAFYILKLLTYVEKK